MTPLKTVAILSLLTIMLGMVTTKPGEQIQTTSEHGNNKTGLMETADLTNLKVLASSPEGDEQIQTQPEQRQQTIDEEEEEQNETPTEQKQQTVDNGDEEQTDTQTERKQQTVYKEDVEQTLETLSAEQKEQYSEEGDEQTETLSEQKEQYVEEGDEQTETLSEPKEQYVEEGDEQTEQIEQTVDEDYEEQTETLTEQTVDKYDEEQTETLSEQKEQYVEEGDEQTEIHTGVMEATDSSETIVLASSPAPISFQCSGSTSRKCDSKLCKVLCSDGHKVQLHCEDEGIKVNSNQVGGLIHMQVSCGKKVQFKACFPFCKDKQTLDTDDEPNPFANPNPYNVFNQFGRSF